MERLTDGIHHCIETFCTKTDCALYEACPALERNNRLAKYEETGVTPEEFKAAFTEEALLKLTAHLFGMEPEQLKTLCIAEVEGRNKVLPCKIGSTVYRVIGDKKKQGHIAEAVVSGIHIGDIKGKRRKTDYEYLVLKNDGDFVAHVELKKIGKTVFLTREAALEAIERGAE